MTAEEIDAMTPEQINVAVAERVMGWENCAADEPFRPHMERGGLILESGPEIFPTFSSSAIPKPWRPSADIAAAWDVAEVMRERGYWLTLTGGFEGWTARFDGVEGSHLGRDVNDAAAISKAALRATLHA